MNRMKQLREERCLSMKEVAAGLGLPYTTYVNYEKGLREPGAETLIRIAEFYDTTLDCLLGKGSGAREARVPPGFLPLPETYRVPLVGRVACGTPITAEQNVEGYVDVPSDRRADFGLLCRGDSMVDAGILDGDIVYVRAQPDVESGQIAVVRIGEEATLKRVYKYPDRVVLQPANANYAPQIYVGEEINQVHIEGRAVGWMHWE